MALSTRITRSGVPVELKWSWWHVECMAAAAAIDEGLFTEEEYCSDKELNSIPRSGLHSTGKHVVKVARHFVDPYDGETLDLEPGDVLEMWRN